MSRLLSPLSALYAALLVTLAGCDKPPADTPSTPDEEIPVIDEGATVADETIAATDASLPSEEASVTDGTAASPDDAVAATDVAAIPAEEPAATEPLGAPADTDETALARPDATALPSDTLGDESTLEALLGEREIPYPIYPDGTRYRVGGENGLRIVLFETGDGFEEVDTFYQQHAETSGMPRLIGMDDYVRYARSGDEGADDPWATHRPGIVIHRFRDDEERAAVGAGEEARTNIIVSFF